MAVVFSREAATSRSCGRKPADQKNPRVSKPRSGDIKNILESMSPTSRLTFFLRTPILRACAQWHSLCRRWAQARRSPKHRNTQAAKRRHRKQPGFDVAVSRLSGLYGFSFCGLAPAATRCRRFATGKPKTKKTHDLQTPFLNSQTLTFISLPRKC